MHLPAVVLHGERAEHGHADLFARGNGPVLVIPDPNVFGHVPPHTPTVVAAG